MNKTGALSRLTALPDRRHTRVRSHAKHAHWKRIFDIEPVSAATNRVGNKNGARCTAARSAYRVGLHQAPAKSRAECVAVATGSAQITSAQPLSAPAP